MLSNFDWVVFWDLEFDWRYLFLCRKELSLSTGTHLIPHPKKVNDVLRNSYLVPPSYIFTSLYFPKLKVETGGEDAFFVGSCNGSVVAIADGVSG